MTSSPYATRIGRRARSYATLVVSELPFRIKERTVALIDPKVMSELGLSAGDVISIEPSKRESHPYSSTMYAILWRSRSEDYGRNTIRIDSLARMNVGIMLGEKAVVRKVKKLLPARRVTLLYSEKLVAGNLEERLLSYLEGNIVTVGMEIPVKILTTTPRFVVVNTIPAGSMPLIISRKYTRFLLKPNLQPPKRTTRQNPLDNIAAAEGGSLYP